MQIDHVAMYVEDLERAKEFFVRYFGGIANDGYHNRKTDFRSYFLTFEKGARLEIMKKPGVSKVDGKSQQVNGSCGQERLGYTHIAFSVGSRENVDALTTKLKADGYEVVSVPRTTGDGYYESCVVCVEGNLVEITV